MKFQADDYTPLAVSAAQDAGEFLRRRLFHAHEIEYKGDINLVTESDRMSEEMIVSRIRQVFPGHDIVTEESPVIDNGSSFRWIIDPLDGTTNFAHGYPVFCVSIALEFQGDVMVGVICHPMMDELFVAQRGRGAMLNGQKISVSSTADISRSLLATGFPYDIRETKQDNIANFTAMAKRAQAIRRPGAAALDLAYLAAGRFDGFWELKLAPWDTAAGCLLVTEAGGRVSDINGDPFRLTAPHLLASNGKIHEAMLAILKDVTDIA